MNPHKLSALFLLAFSIAAPLAVLAARPIPFSESHPQYMAALARAFAQEVEQNAGIKPSDLDEQFTPEDFGLTEVGFLPNNPLYLFKAARRGFSDALTRNPAEKLQNSLRFAAEKLLEAEALSNSGARETSVASALDGFKREINRARARAAAASSELGDSAEGVEVGRAMMDAVIKYEKLIGKIEKGTSGSAVSAAAEAKGGAAEALGAAFTFVPPEDAAETLSGVFDAQRGSDFKEFKNLEVLKTIEEKAPESAKAAVRAAQENELAKLEGNLDAAGAGSRAGFGDIVQNIGGNETRHLEIINDLEVRPLSEAARATLSAAKEEVLSRAETRLTGLSETEKRAFLGHLNDGNIEDLRVVNELEKNVSTEALSGVSDLASSAQESFTRRVESAATNAGEREKLLESVERFHDAKSLSVLDEIEALIPPEQRSIFASLKQKAAAEIQKDISEATGAAQERAYYQALGGDHPEEFKALESVGGVSGEILQGIRSATTEHIKSRAGVIRDEARFGKYEEALRTSSGDNGISSGELATFFAEQRSVYGSRDKAERKIAEAATLVDALSELASSLPLNLGYGEEGFDPSIRDAARLLSSAEGRLSSARAALARNAFGLAYGEAQEAAFAARDGANIARSYKAGKRVIVPVVEKEKPIPLPIVDPTEEDLDKPDKDKAISCQAYFEGYVFDEKVGACKKQSASGCSNPFVYKTKEQCETAVNTEGREDGKNKWVEHTWRFADGLETSMILDRTDSEYRNYIKNTEVTCRLMPKQQFLWRKGAGNDASDNWQNFGIPDCSGQAFAPANCGNNICESGETAAKCPKDCTGGKKAEDTYSCPGFAHERIDGKGKRYCQLNARTACSYAFPQFLYEDSYTSSLCPTATTGVTDDTVATSTRQFENCGSHTSRLGCEFRASCDWYIPTQGSPYCAPAVRNSWVSHTWRFSDGGTETSSILNRADREYSEFIASVDAQCKTITRTKFAWKQDAGNDAPDNWQNFGIPDCSGTASGGNTGGGYGGDANSCPGFAFSKWDKSGKRYCQLNSEKKCDYNYPSYLTNGPNYTAGSCPAEDTTGGTATTTTGSTPQCSDGKDNDNDGKTDYPDDTSCYGKDDWDEWYPSSTTGGGGTSGMQKCFYPNASKNGAPVGYTVWCEADYAGCRKGNKDGEVISTTGIIFGTPSSCEGGWTGGSGSCNNNNYCDSWESQTACPVECANGPGTYTTGTCNNNNYCDPWENKASCPVECANGPGTYTTGSCNSNNYCDTWENATSCPSECSGGSGGGSGGVPAIPTGVTAAAPSTGNTVEIRWTDASTNETYFKIWRQANGSWAFLTQTSSAPENKTTTGTVMSYPDQNVPSGSVSYQIQACNETSCSQDSSLATAWVAGGGGTNTTTTTNTNTTTGTTNTTTNTTNTTTGGGTTGTSSGSLQRCFYPNASKNGSYVGYTVWCESDYVNCHEGSPSGASISTTGLSLGAPSSCDSGWTGGGGSTGGSTSTICDSATTALLGTGCHSMGSAFFNSEMTRYVWPGGSTVLECATGYISGCSGSGGGSSSSGSTTASSCSSGQYWNGTSCVSSSTTSCPSGQYWNGSSCVTSPSGGQYGSCGSYTTQSSCTGATNCYWYNASSGGTSYCYYSSSGGASIWHAFSSWLKGK